MTILLATSNPHKVEEIREVFAEMAQGDRATAIDLASLDDLGRRLPEPVEDRPTFEGNAEKKAVHYATLSGLLSLADDSGLEVDALGGEPGVRSARYAGAEGPRSTVDPANNALLLERLGTTPVERRSARFVCAMALAAGPSANGAASVIAAVRGTIEGRILGPGDEGFAPGDSAGRGGNGFGYDPLFLVRELGRTTAELSPQEKNRISHRGQAARKMWRHMAAMMEGGGASM